MTIRHLKIFVQVYKDMNMTAAAKSLYMTQPSVSQAIRELEDYYGVTLFERLSQRLYVTSAGEKLFHYACGILSLFQELEGSLKADAGHMMLRIGANYTAGISMIHTYTTAFKELHPDAGLQVYVNKASVLKDMLRNNSLDLAILEKSHDEPDFAHELLCQDRIVIVVHPDFPIAQGSITPQELATFPLLLREPGAGARDMFENRMKELGYPISPSWESISATALIQAVLLQNGIGILPMESVRTLLEHGTLRELSVPSLDLSRELVIMYHKNKYLSTGIKEFIALCLKQSPL